MTWLANLGLFYCGAAAVTLWHRRQTLWLPVKSHRWLKNPSPSPIDPFSFPTRTGPKLAAHGLGHVAALAVHRV